MQKPVILITGIDIQKRSCLDWVAGNNTGNLTVQSTETVNDLFGIIIFDRIILPVIDDLLNDCMHIIWNVVFFRNNLHQCRDLPVNFVPGNSHRGFLPEVRRQIT